MCAVPEKINEILEIKIASFSWIFIFLVTHGVNKPQIQK